MGKRELRLGVLLVQSEIKAVRPGCWHFQIAFEPGTVRAGRLERIAILVCQTGVGIVKRDGGQGCAAAANRSKECGRNAAFGGCRKSIDQRAGEQSPVGKQTFYQYGVGGRVRDQRLNRELPDQPLLQEWQE